MMGVPGFPCELITKLNDCTVNNGTFAGIYIGYAVNQTNSYCLKFSYMASTVDGLKLLVVQKVTGASGSSSYDYVAYATALPLWLKIRINGFANGNTITFWYSADGTNWTQYASGGGALVVTDYFGSPYDAMCGVFVNNSSDPNDNAIDAPFEFFKIVRPYGA
jgi:hypothetical protein